MKLAPGFYEGISFDDYKQIDAMNYSSLKYMERSPMTYRHKRENPPEPTAPMILGNAAHKAILEPSLAKFAVWPGPGRRFGHAYDDWCELNAGKTLLNEKENAHVEGMALAVHANPVAHKYLRHIRSEVTMVWRDPSFKRDMKARLDAITDIVDEQVLVSLKSTVDCRDFRFASQYAQMSYHAQDAIYQNGYFQLTGTLPRMVTVAVEKLPPYEIAVYNIPVDVLRLGQQQVSKWLELLAECERTNKWPGAVEGEQDLVLPAWATPGGDFEFADLEPLER
jgi:exodeoxyribonuclease VIII